MRGYIYKLTLVNKFNLQEDFVCFEWFFAIPEELLFLGLGLFGAVFGTGLHSAVNALCIEGASDDVVTHTGKVLYTAASDQNNRVLLQVMTHARNVSRNFNTVRETNSGELSERGVGLFGGIGFHYRAHASLLGRIVIGGDVLLGVEPFTERRSLALFLKRLSRIVNELVKRWQAIAPPFLIIIYH